MSRICIRSLVLMAGTLSLTGCDSWDSFQKPPNFSGPGGGLDIPTPRSSTLTTGSNLDSEF